MKTNKIIIETKEWTKEIMLKNEYDMTQDEWKKAVQNLMSPHTTIIKVYDANKHHICKYCGEVANGPDEDVLCKDCREIFGHAFYSEL